ncbi:hypothetical protein ACIQU2_27160 [Pseudomonas sp. NPDC098740]|uniref:hypothetical protein n=1 Tax=Pseudomonas sp. NPDC098740 TaxID=3364486 RepID=UPI00383A480D
MFALAPFILLLVSLVIFHWLGYRTRGAISKTFWKAGDYIWLSMACFALIVGSYELRKAVSESVIAEVKANQIKYFVLGSDYNSLAAFAFIEKSNGLPKSSGGKLSSDSFDIESKFKELDASIAVDSRRLEQASSSIGKNNFEKIIVYWYPFFLALALSIRVTMASAEVFNWYKKEKPPATNDAAQKFDADQSVKETTAKLPST